MPAAPYGSTPAAQALPPYCGPLALHAPTILLQVRPFARYPSHDLLAAEPASSTTAMATVPRPQAVLSALVSRATFRPIASAAGNPADAYGMAPPRPDNAIWPIQRCSRAIVDSALHAAAADTPQSHMSPAAALLLNPQQIRCYTACSGEGLCFSYGHGARSLDFAATYLPRPNSIPAKWRKALGGTTRANHRAPRPPPPQTNGHAEPPCSAHTCDPILPARDDPFRPAVKPGTP